MKKQKTTVKQFKEELIASIQNENRHFDMGTWTTDNTKVATCGTACCMAGHIEALRPKLAKKLAPKFTDTELGYIDHEQLAEEIWAEETGYECRLDFCALHHPSDQGYDSQTGWMKAITRKEAIAHIRGSKRWPQLKR